MTIEEIKSYLLSQAKKGYSKIDITSIGVSPMIELGLVVDYFGSQKRVNASPVYGYEEGSFGAELQSAYTSTINKTKDRLVMLVRTAVVDKLQLAVAGTYMEGLLHDPDSFNEVRYRLREDHWDLNYTVRYKDDGDSETILELSSLNLYPDDERVELHRSTVL